MLFIDKSPIIPRAFLFENRRISFPYSHKTKSPSH